jgi:AcrR family transcriptional regulator
MNPQVRTKPDETRARIIETAEALFRRLGYAKTAVADIAAELGMSPANVYRFFPSKTAIVEAFCQRCLNELEEKVWAAARAKGPASRRLEDLFIEILTYHRENLLTEQRVNELVLVAMESSWETIRRHKEVMYTVVEVLLRDGMASGEFEDVDARSTAIMIMEAMVGYCHPMLLAHCLAEGKDVEAGARDMIAFLLRAVAKRS